MPWKLLARYFAGELMGEELQEMERWINTDAERKDQVEKLYILWKESEKLPYTLDVDRAWNSLSFNLERMDRKAEKLRKISQDNYKVIPTLKNYSYKTDRISKPGLIARRVALLAATIAIIATAGYFSHFIHQSSLEISTADVSYRVLETQNGERASYNLSDGSKVFLHAGSKLQVPENFNDDSRELTLEGEAYFEVSHNPEKPFIVQSEFSYTQVIGTKFLVHAWPDESRDVEVVVSEGKVLLGDSRYQKSQNKKEAYISKNQKGVLTAESDLVVTEENDIQWYMGWTEGRLIFNNREFQDVLPKLERWYDIDIQISDMDILKKKITAEIDYSLPMTDVLQGMALSLDLKIERTGRVFRFK